jgi:transposase InsO family protein
MTVGLYASAEFRGWCAGNNVAQSMGKAGVCRDNAVAENFFAHLKTELYHHGFTSRLAARTSVMDYIESWYNRKRPTPNARAGHRPPAAALTARPTRDQETWPRNRNTT